VYWEAASANEWYGLPLARSKLGEAFPVSPEETLKTLAAFGLIDESPGLIDRLIYFYASQVIAFYHPEPRRFYVVKGAAK
jgi:hypothetical protein